jgi:hypothetical protein
MKNFLRPPFLIVALVLLTAGAGLKWTVQKFELFLSKAPISPRQPLHMIPASFGPYELAAEQPELTPEVEAILGARAYITREYLDTRREEGSPGSLIRMHIAYWTGTPDTVMHVPEVCYIAGGAQGLKFNNTAVVISSDQIEDRNSQEVTATNSLGEPVRLSSTTVPLRVFSYVPVRADEEMHVSYFFIANGNFKATTESVRTLVFHVHDKYAYWCKVEVLPIGIANYDDAVEAVRQFLSFALPEIMTCLPDWAEVRAGKYPVGDTDEI